MGPRPLPPPPRKVPPPPLKPAPPPDPAVPAFAPAPRPQPLPQLPASRPHTLHPQTPSSPGPGLPSGPGTPCPWPPTTGSVGPGLLLAVPSPRWPPASLHGHEALGGHLEGARSPGCVTGLGAGPAGSLCAAPAPEARVQHLTPSRPCSISQGPLDAGEEVPARASNASLRVRGDALLDVGGAGPGNPGEAHGSRVPRPSAFLQAQVGGVGGWGVEGGGARRPGFGADKSRLRKVPDPARQQLQMPSPSDPGASGTTSSDPLNSERSLGRGVGGGLPKATGPRGPRSQASPRSTSFTFIVTVPAGSGKQEEIGSSPSRDERGSQAEVRSRAAPRTPHQRGTGTP